MDLTEIYNGCNTGRYTNTATYARKRTAPNPVTDAQILAFLRLEQGASLSLAEATAKLVVAEEQALEINNRHAERYAVEESRITDLFWSDIAEAFNFSNPQDPMLGALCSYAWEHGHSGGFHEVATVFANLHEKFQPVIRDYVLVKRPA